jgi:hypothetical protein
MAAWTRRLAGGSSLRNPTLGATSTRRSCRSEVCFDLLPRDRCITVGDLGPGRLGGPDGINDIGQPCPGITDRDLTDGTDDAAGNADVYIYAVTGLDTQTSDIRHDRGQ